MLSILLALSLFTREPLEVCIVDAETRQPLPKGRVEFRVRGENGSMSGSTSFLAPSVAHTINVASGTAEFRASAPGYLSQSLRVEIKRRSATSIQFALERGIHVPLAIMTSDGKTIARARILEQTAGGIISDSADDGTYLFAGRAGESHLLYVVPSEGSFAIVRLTVPDHDRTDPLPVVVPAPAGDVRVKARGSRLNLFFEGKLLPPEVVQAIAPGVRYSGTGEFFLSRLPRGFYEIWTAEGCETFIPGFIGPETRVTFSVPRSTPL